MINFLDSNERLQAETERCLDSQLWHACAGSMVHIPPVNSPGFYFPQGHFEHASGNVDLRNFPRFPSCIPCVVSTVKFMADPKTDEVFAKIRLVPSADNLSFSVDISENESKDPTSSFSAKTLTQSDANNGGGFSVPRYCAETVFPTLDLSADPPAQTIHVKDVHGQIWTFRHIYRGTPRRHLLTTGWSNFVNSKQLIAGDSVIFLKADNGDLCVGIRRAKRGRTQVWNPAVGFSSSDSTRNDTNSNVSVSNNGGLKVEDVFEAARLAASGKAFEVVYYPRGGGPEFFVKASLVKEAMRVRWAAGMRFKMAFETEDWMRTSWFMGTITSVQVADRVRWPDSPWRLLQVKWDEPDLLQDVKHVNPWLVELVPPIDLSPFSPPLKRLKLPQHLDFKGQIPSPALSYDHIYGSYNPFNCVLDNAPAGMQGARHAQFGSSLSSLNQSSLFPFGFKPLGLASRPTRAFSPAVSEPINNENISRLQESKKSNFVLFGQTILTEKQISESCSSGTASTVRAGNSSDGSGSGLNRNDVAERSSSEGVQSGPGLETGRCEVFMGSGDVGRALDLHLLGSYDELYEKLASLFGIEISNILNRVVVYQDNSGAIRRVGYEPFSNFAKTTRRLTILADRTVDNAGV